jgi:hypothetical protein
MLLSKTLLTVSLLVVSYSTSLAAEPVAPSWRTWTRSDKHEVRGMLMNVTDAHVILLLEDATQITLNREDLASADRKLATSFTEQIAAMKAPINATGLGAGFELRHGELPAQLPNFPSMTFDAVFRNDLPEGLAQYRSATGKLCQVEPQHDGQLHGTKVQFYPTGELYSLIFMDQGVPVGIHPRFFPNGYVATLVSWENGEQHGFYISYFENGMKKDVYPLVHGIKQGESVHFAPQGYHYAAQRWEDGGPVDRVVLRELDAHEYAEIVTSNIKQFGEIWDGAAP